MTYIILGQEVEGAEDLVIVELEALGGLQTAKVVGLGRHLRALQMTAWLA